MAKILLRRLPRKSLAGGQGQGSRGREVTYRVVEVEGGFRLELDGRIVEGVLKRKWDADEVASALNEIEWDSRAPQVSDPGDSGPKASVTAKAQNTAAGAGLRMGGEPVLRRGQAVSCGEPPNPPG
jgi:hypothetical protein